MGERGVGGKSLAAGGLAVGDEIVIDVERAAGDGVCVARHEGQVVFVRDVLPGEQARVRVTAVGRKGRFVRAELAKLLRASDRRVVPPCNLARECGGCDWQHADLGYQRELKRDILLENLRKFGGIDVAAANDIQSVDSTVPNDLHVGSDGDVRAGSGVDVSAGSDNDARAGSGGDGRAGSGVGDLSTGSGSDVRAGSGVDVSAGSGVDERAGSDSNLSAGSGNDVQVGRGLYLDGRGHPLGAVSVEALPDAPGAAPGLGYRTRMRFAINDAGLVGLKAARSHKIIPAADCLLPVPEISDAVPESVTNFGAERALVAVASAEVASDAGAGGGDGSDVGADTDAGADDELHPEIFEPDVGGAGKVGGVGGAGKVGGAGQSAATARELAAPHEPGSGQFAAPNESGSGQFAASHESGSDRLAAPHETGSGRFAASDDGVPMPITAPGGSTPDRLDLPDESTPAGLEAEFGKSTPAGLEAEFGGQDTHRPVAAEVRGRAFEVDLNGFWQVHRSAPETLVNAVLEFAQVRTGETVFDLYGGVGLFAAFLAEATGPGGAVHLIEGDAGAVEYAKQNLDDLPWVTTTCADVRDLAQLAGVGQGGATDSGAETDGGGAGALGLANHPLHSLHPAAPRHLTDPVAGADLVVADPPRAGLGAEVVAAIAAQQPSRVVYVSCDSATFARDVKTFAEHGYALDQLRAFDLFPMTKHLETVALLVPQNG